MSAYQRRQRSSETTNRDSRGNKISSAGCYAIANEASSVSGIYFSEEEATKKIMSIRKSPYFRDRNSNNDNLIASKGIDFCRFDKLSNAEAFLKERGFAPKVAAGGWVSARNRNPILYSPNGKSHEHMTTAARLHQQGNSSTKNFPSVENSRPGNVTPQATRMQQIWSNHQHHGSDVDVAIKGPSVTQTPLKGVPLHHVGENDGENSPSLKSSSRSSSASEIPAAVSSISPFFQPKKKQPAAVTQSQPQPKQRNRRSKEERQRTRKRQRVEGNRNEGYRPKPNESQAAAAARMFAGPAPDFDEIQQEAIDAAMAGKNIFITGVAGTGKSIITKKIVQDAQNLGREVAVAAPTGVAAVNLGPELGAQTVHSLLGVGVPQAAAGFEKMLAPWIAKKWRSIQVLVFDEIGMLSADFLDWMDVYIRKVRRNPLEAFGGIQLVFVGDFAQLGPIPDKGKSLLNKAFEPNEPGADCLLGIRECAAYAFQTVLWREADFHHVHLRKVYRQKKKDFQLALMDIREAKAESPRVRNLVEICSTPLEERRGQEIPEGIKPTILYCTNRNVDRENSENLAMLTDKGKVFTSTDSTEVSNAVNLSSRATVDAILTKNPFFRDCSASSKIHLKVGAQVMLLKNLDTPKGLVNGSRGVVEAFKLCPVARDILHGNERLIGPDDTDKFPGWRFEDIKYDTKMEFEGKIWRICRFDRYPLVRFVNNIRKIITPHTFERDLYRQGKCLREQVPLRLAWALTIHKSQGTTLDYVVCDLQGCFTSGQAYVALSRARSLMGLQIKNFRAEHVTADPLVKAFYEALDRYDMKSFLEDQAGLWWFPILKSPTWLKMFKHASSKAAKFNSQQFRSWVADYKPLEDYQGWGA